MGGFSAAFDLLRKTVDGIRGPAAGGAFECFVAGIFLISGILKLRRPTLTAMAIVDFGIGRRVRPVLGRALGVVEVALAVLLLIPSRLGLWAAATLLWLFTFMIARSLVAGERFACFCFGDGSAMLSWRTLARTTALGVLATLLLTGSASAVQLVSGDHLLQMVLAAAFIAVMVLGTRAVELLRRNGASLRALQEPVA